jgi:hypothetical protein
MENEDIPLSLFLKKVIQGLFVCYGTIDFMEKNVSPNS